MRDNRLYLNNIKECIERIESYTSEGREAFMQTPMIQDAVIRNFEIIGEATKRLSAELRISYPKIPGLTQLTQAIANRCLQHCVAIAK